MADSTSDLRKQKRAQRCKLSQRSLQRETGFAPCAVCGSPFSMHRPIDNVVPLVSRRDFDDDDERFDDDYDDDDGSESSDFDSAEEEREREREKRHERKRRQKERKRERRRQRHDAMQAEEVDDVVAVAGAGSVSMAQQAAILADVSQRRRASSPHSASSASSSSSASRSSTTRAQPAQTTSAAARGGQLQRAAAAHNMSEAAFVNNYVRARQLDWGGLTLDQQADAYEEWLRVNPGRSHNSFVTVILNGAHPLLYADLNAPRLGGEADNAIEIDGDENAAAAPAGNEEKPADDAAGNDNPSILDASNADADADTRENEEPHTPNNADEESDQCRYNGATVPPTAKAWIAECIATKLTLKELVTKLKVDGITIVAKKPIPLKLTQVAMYLCDRFCEAAYRDDNMHPNDVLCERCTLPCKQHRAARACGSSMTQCKSLSTRDPDRCKNCAVLIRLHHRGRSGSSGTPQLLPTTPPKSAKEPASSNTPSNANNKANNERVHTQPSSLQPPVQIYLKRKQPAAGRRGNGVGGGGSSSSSSSSDSGSSSSSDSSSSDSGSDSNKRNRKRTKRPTTRRQRREQLQTLFTGGGEVDEKPAAKAERLAKEAVADARYKMPVDVKTALCTFRDPKKETMADPNLFLKLFERKANLIMIPVSRRREALIACVRDENMQSHELGRNQAGVCGQV